MKTKYIFFSLVALCMLSACTKDEEVAITTVQINNLSIAPQYTRSAFACDLVANSPIADVELQYSTDSLFGEGLYQTLQLNQNEHHYTANLESLQQGQTYYVRYKVFNSFNSMIPARVDTFRTRAYTVPSVRTDSVTHITTHSADCYFTLTDWGCDSLPIVGVCFSTSLSDRTNIPCTTTLSDSTFVCSLSDLTDGKTYSVYALAKNAQGTAYSEKVITFTTIAIVPPTITTADVTAISYTSAVCGGDISSDGNAEVTERGICYGTTAQPTTKDSVILCGSGTGAFSTVLPNLQDGTTYYVRAFATNSKGTAYGEQKIFATPAYSLPTLTTAEVTNISYTTATCGGNITSAGGQTITACGVCYSTKSNPTIADNKVASDSRTSFSCNLTGLADGTTYYVRAYATNGKGTAYGDQKTFTTTSYYAPTVSTNSPQNISFTTTTCGGKVLTDGALSITDKGICYGTSPSPTVNSQKISCGTGLGDFTCTLSNLRDSTVYYARAYAVNAKGIAYGEQVSWRTKGYALPTLSTIAASNITFTSATCGGSITSDGNAEITSRGICYSTKSNPTISSSKVTSGSGTGTFTCNLANLSDGTTYYARAYATNKKGTAYGAQISWITKAYALPTVSTTEAQKVSYTTATCGGNVTSDGSLSVTSRGICYSTQPNPTISNTKVASGSGTGAFTCNLTGLSDGTTYYARAYATNGKGTAYGEQISWTTKEYELPAVGTYYTKVLTSTTAECRASADVPNDGVPITEKGICYSTQHLPTISNHKIINGGSYSYYTCSLSGLTANATYYVRAYAINAKGVAYGEERELNMSFGNNEYVPKAFSVSSVRKVVFARGNLQYQASSDTWRFANYQYEHIGDANKNISKTYAGWIDLFGWGTGNNPTLTSDDISNYQTFVDWGINRIDGDTPNTWRTLSADEWRYILETRVNASNLCGIAYINGEPGVVLLPDDWVQPQDVTFMPGGGALHSYKCPNWYSTRQWQKIESAGAVFFPLTCGRIVTQITSANYGYYWSSSIGQESYALGVTSIGSVFVEFNGATRSYGFSVRLVKDL